MEVSTNIRKLRTCPSYVAALARSVRLDTLCDIRQTSFGMQLRLGFEFIHHSERSLDMTNRNSVNDKVEALGNDIAATVNDLMREAKPLLHHAADRVSDRVSELTQKGLDAATRGQHQLAHAGHDMSDHAADMIRHEPFKAMLIAAGVGAAAMAVVGLMSRSNSSHKTH
jgi:ElaB/YqjD/DUF883 family membrane-anchored ribosome-binding protein